MKGPGKAGPLPPCYVNVTSRHRIACQRYKPLTQGFLLAPAGPQFCLWMAAFFHFGPSGLVSLAFWPFGPSFPLILALWAFISMHFGLVGLHFHAFWPFWPCGLSFPCILAFSGSASGAPPTCCQKWPVCPTSLQWIYQRRDRLHFAVSSLLGLHFLAFWPCGPSFPVKPLPSANDPCLK